MLDSYTNLKTAIGTLLNRNDLTSVIPDWITMVEAHLQRVLEGRPMLVSQAVTFDTTGQFTLPTDFRSPTALNLEDTTYFWPVDLVPYAVLSRKRLELTNGPPRYATIQNNTVLVAPIPDASYSGTLQYEAELTPLSDSVSTNWVLTSHPDIYLYGAAVHSAPWLRDDARLPMWKDLYDAAIEEVRLARDRAEYGTSSPRVVPRRVIGE